MGGGREEASGGGIERGREGAREGNFKGCILRRALTSIQYSLGLERIHQVTNTIRIAIQGGEYDTYHEYTFSQRLN